MNSNSPYKPMKNLKCNRCARVVTSDKIQVGQKHKPCMNSPRGRLVKI